MNASARKVSVQFLSWLSDEEMMEQWKKTHPLFTVCVAVLLYSLQPRVQEYGSSVCPFSSDIIDTEAHLNLHIYVQSAENKLNVAWCPQHKDCCPVWDFTIQGGKRVNRLPRNASLTFNPTYLVFVQYPCMYTMGGLGSLIVLNSRLQKNNSDVWNATWRASAMSCSVTCWALSTNSS